MTQREDGAQDVSTSSMAPSTSPMVIGWGLAALSLAIFTLIFNTSPLVLGASIMAKVFAAVVATVLGTLGALLGNVIRKAAQPDVVFTQRGFLGLIWIRIFWAIGPQVIGLFAGVFIGSAIVLG